MDGCFGHRHLIVATSRFATRLCFEQSTELEQIASAMKRWSTALTSSENVGRGDEFNQDRRVSGSDPHQDVR